MVNQTRLALWAVPTASFALLDQVGSTPGAPGAWLASGAASAPGAEAASGAAAAPGTKLASILSSDIALDRTPARGHAPEQARCGIPQNDAGSQLT